MTDIVDRLRDMFFRFGKESPDDAANRRIQTAKDAADEIEKLRAALRSVMVGGNHLACVIGPNHLLHTASYEDALKHYGPGDIYDVWCCWKNIMEARAKLGEKE
jgi:predicted MPP superfamily phosphohydrolase